MASQSRNPTTSPPLKPDFSVTMDLLLMSPLPHLLSLPALPLPARDSKQHVYKDELRPTAPAPFSSQVPESHSDPPQI